MKSRNPLLFERLIGQFDVERKVSSISENLSLAEHILRFHDEEALKLKRDTQLRFEQETFSEHESSSSEDGSHAIVDSSVKTRNEALSELQRLSEESFLEGQDEDFDYNLIDFSNEYDDLDQESRDAEDRYFNTDDVDDSEVPENAHAMEPDY